MTVDKKFNPDHKVSKCEKRSMNGKWLICVHPRYAATKTFILRHLIPINAAECFQCASAVTQQRGLQRAADRQDVLVDQLDGTGPVRDLVIEVVGQPRPLQLQLLGLQGRLCWRLCGGRRKERKITSWLVLFYRTCEIHPGEWACASFRKGNDKEFLLKVLQNNC